MPFLEPESCLRHGVTLVYTSSVRQVSSSSPSACMGGAWVGWGGVQDMQHETILIFCSDVFTAIVDVVCSLFKKKRFKGLFMVESALSLSS